MIALVTDSNAQLPDQLVERFSLSVVPVTVVVDGVSYQEGVDLDVAQFYQQLRHGATVSTSAPSPGVVAEAYQRSMAAGCKAILSIHTGSKLSGTVNAARIAAQTADVPVRILDTGTASFAVGCCVWAAAERLREGASLEEAAREALAVAGKVGNVFIVGALGLARLGGRLDPTVDASGGLPILVLEDGLMRQVGQVTDPEGAVQAMADYVWSRADRPIRVGVGDAELSELAERLSRELGTRDNVVEVVRYQVGPSVAAHTGVGTVGAVFY